MPCNAVAYFPRAARPLRGWDDETQSPAPAPAVDRPVTRVRLQSVAKEFGTFAALRGIDLDIRSGELVALLGPSGCGKTTTLRMIAGLEVPSSGQILFDGRDVSDMRVQDRNVGMVFQHYALFPHMTVERNVAFGLEVRGIPRDEVAARVDEMLGIVQLDAFRHRFPAQLSGGQMQRVAIARTLITRPAVLMMDEPLANLDTGLRGEMRRFIRDLQQRMGITTIFVTHDQVEAMELADRVAVIFDGHLAQFAAPDELYRRPVSVAVARFMGASNILPARIDHDGRAVTGFGALPVDTGKAFPPGASVDMMLREEAIDMHAAAASPPAEGIRGRVVARDYFGASVSYTIDCAGTPISVSEPSRRVLDIGTEVTLSIPPDRIWLMPGGKETDDIQTRTTPCDTPC